MSHKLKKLRIVHVIERLSAVHGGSTAAALAIAEATRDDFSVQLLGPDELGVPEGRHIVPLTGGRLGFPCKALRWLYHKRNEIDILEVHNVFSPISLVTMIYCGIMRRPFVLNPHNSLDPLDLRKKRIRKLIVGYFFLSWAVAGSGFVRCATKRELQRLVTFGRRWRADWALLPIRLSTNPCERDATRKMRIAGGGVLKILFLSRIDRKKRLEILIDGIATAKPQLGSFKLLIGGTGDQAYEGELKARIATLRLEADVEWRGFLQGEAKAAIFREADVFMLPSAYENFGIVVLEALASGLKPVVSDNVFVADHLREGDCLVISNDSAYVKLLQELRVNVENYWVSASAAAEAGLLLQGAQGTCRINKLYNDIAADQSR